MENIDVYTRKHHEVVVLGAGPGGLQLAHLLGESRIDYVVLERSSGPGSFFERFPVHRKLLSINKINTGFTDPEKNLRWDWNSLMSSDPTLRFGKYDQEFFPSADSFVTYLRDFCSQMRINVVFDCNVTYVSKRDEVFVVVASDGREFTCDLLVVATGTPTPYVPAIQGAECAEQYASLDRSVERCLNKDILILGKGNSAFETAQEFLPHAARIHLISPGVLKLAWQSHFPGHVRQINSPFLETFLLKQQNAVVNGTIQAIEKVGDRFAVNIIWSENGAQARHTYDRVILCTGFKFDPLPFADSLKPEVVYDGRLPALTSHWESVNVPGLYFCGALMQTNDYKKSAASFIHGMRYTAQTLSRILKTRLRSTPYPAVKLPLDAEIVFDHIYRRMRQVSSLWHMHGTYCDAYIPDPQRAYCECLQDLPTQMLAEDPAFGRRSRIEFRFTFENPKDPIERENFTPIGLLHPVLHFFVNGEWISECHMHEDVYAEWESNDQFGSRFLDALTAYADVLRAA